MSRYPLNLPMQLKQEAEIWAAEQGISLNQFIMWAVAEKVAELRQNLDDPAFPQVTYRRGTSGTPTPVLRGVGVRVQTIVIAAERWQMSPEHIAAEYGLELAQVEAALRFYAAHRAEIAAALAVEETLERAHA